jgi:hypothetical protein
MNIMKLKLTLLITLVCVHAQQLKGIIGQDNWTTTGQILSLQLQSTMRQQPYLG